MRFIYIEPPKIVRKIFRDFIWENNNDEILITIDDGPFPSVTENILRFLNSTRTKALFFVTGKNVKQNFFLFEEILDDGHFVANHSFNHSKEMTKMDLDELRMEIISTEGMISFKKNFRKLFRPPYGKINLRMNRALKEMNYKIFMWSLLTEDYLGDFKLVKKNLDKHLRKNSIVVFHNNPKSQNIIEASLDYTFNLAEKRGYKIGSTFNF
ncbi:MAG: polysaccharide deacetylase family protein [Ignavibacteria bacterium]|nr:polysaccharide deacetylase family protein [Ignavibacteria bacterium]